MKAAILKDSVIRTIEIRVIDGPVLDVSQAWHSKPRRIQVERVVITVIDGETRKMELLGGTVLKTGRPSQTQRGHKVFYTDQWTVTDEKISSAPPWAQVFWREAPAGVSYWWPDQEKVAGL